MNLCKYAINRELQALYGDGEANTPLITTKGGNGQYDTGNGQRGMWFCQNTQYGPHRDLEPAV
ncbi:hypothetical protein [Pseudomonas savastanoi]|uniref:hypothetical protein n=1 Tax=Pseudomonas savastanoi TaxID=29438 RepID=UPI001CE39E71|nr:hypothetical protein [Pseudomonas savastanoi]